MIAWKNLIFFLARALESKWKMDASFALEKKIGDLDDAAAAAAAAELWSESSARVIDWTEIS